jgi:FkbM family methyltransferase
MQGKCHQTEAPVDLSYAQNLEDYHLAQAFAGQTSGFYIDVGAGHPVADNVSCWFYLQGWAGLVVEPQHDLLALYRHIRPRDIAIDSVLGSAIGETVLYRVERLHGFSTIVPQAAERARGFGVDFTEQRVAMTTLAALCEENRIERIDFLKIDVEGAEADVLRGGDWRRFRPRIILLEALAPGSMAPAWPEWEPFLIAHDYRFGLDDGLNRFYVAAEEPALQERLAKAPAPWLVVPHLGHTNRAPERADHPDHGFAKSLVRNFLASLPYLDKDLLLALALADMDPARLADKPSREAAAIAMAKLFPGPPFAEAAPEMPEPDTASLRDLYRGLIDTDHFRILLGRIAASYDGGQILE